MDTADEDKNFGFWKAEEREVACPGCQKKMALVCKWRTRGAVIGGLSGAALAWNGARAGASVGSAILPGFGTFVGLVTGAALGAATGAAIGDVVDRDIIANYKCHACGCSCRLNE
jgi:Glycine zipper